MKDKDRQISKNDSSGNKNRKPTVTSRQVAAMTGVVLLALLYVVTLILAVVDSSASGKFFALSLCGTLVIPIILFLYSWMYGRITGKKTIGDPEDANDPQEKLLHSQETGTPEA